MQCRLAGRVGGIRCDLEVTGWGLGRPTAYILRSRLRWGLRRVGAEPGPENAPSSDFFCADRIASSRCPCGGEEAAKGVRRIDLGPAKSSAHRCGHLMSMGEKIGLSGRGRRELALLPALARFQTPPDCAAATGPERRPVAQTLLEFCRAAQLLRRATPQPNPLRL